MQSEPTLLESDEGQHSFWTRSLLHSFIIKPMLEKLFYNAVISTLLHYFDQTLLDWFVWGGGGRGFEFSFFLERIQTKICLGIASTISMDLQHCLVEQHFYYFFPLLVEP